MSSILILPESVVNETNTAIEALQSLNKHLDIIVENLDSAVEHYGIVILPMEALDADYEQIPNRDDMLMDINTFVLLSSYLLEHPLLTVMQQIRDESAINVDDTAVRALRHQVKVGQKYTHYKGTVYEIVSIAKDANIPEIEHIHYRDEAGNTWSLNIGEFTKRLDWNGERVNRFQLLTA